MAPAKGRRGPARCHGTGWPGVSCHLPALSGPSHYQNHQKLSKQEGLPSPLTAVSRAWSSKATRCGHLSLWTLALHGLGALPELILEGKICFLSLLAVNLECLAPRLRRAGDAAGSSLRELPQALPQDLERPGRETPHLPTRHSLLSSFWPIPRKALPQVCRSIDICPILRVKGEALPYRTKASERHRETPAARLRSTHSLWVSWASRTSAEPRMYLTKGSQH